MGSRTRGRPTRWIDDIENNLKTLNIKNWQRVAAYRWNWRKRAVEAAKTTSTLTAVPLDLGSNPGEDMGVCKCIVPSQHGGTLNSRRAGSPLVRLVEGEERWEAPDPPAGYSPPKLG
ncbi:uncharacterized protein TNCV_2038171 [Trichonephila clavipes]|nr:uncharacterized protein TNCV_2038171 [Trichonephila clavipes]